MFLHFCEAQDAPIQIGAECAGELSLLGIKFEGRGEAVVSDIGKLRRT